MSNYKVGDKVVIVSDLSHHRIPIGEVVEITRVDCDGYGQVLFAKGMCLIDTECEPYEEPKEDDSFVPKFFQRVAPCEGYDAYYFKQGNIYIEVSPNRYDELDITEQDIEDIGLEGGEDAIVVTDEEGYTLMGVWDLQEDFKEVL